MQCKSYSHFFSKKFQHICVSLDVNFNESLTNDVVSFEHPGPVMYQFVFFSSLKYTIFLMIQAKSLKNQPILPNPHLKNWPPQTIDTPFYDREMSYSSIVIGFTQSFYKMRQKPAKPTVCQRQQVKAGNQPGHVRIYSICPWA